MKEASREGTTFKPTLQLMSGRALGFLGTFFIPVVLARIFDPEGFGSYKQLLLVFATLYAICQCGMAESLFYFIPRAPEKAGRYAANAMIFLGLAGLLTLGFLVLGASHVAAWLGNPGLAPHLGLLGIFLWLALASTPLEIVLTSRTRYLGAATSYGVSDMLRAALFVIPALITRQLEWVIAGAAAFALFRLGAALVWLRAEFGSALRPDLAALRSQLAYALPFQLVVVVETLQANLHAYAVSNRFDAATFAIYSVGCLQLPIVEFLASPAANVMMVRMSEAVREGRPEALLALWHDTTRKLALAFFPLVALLVVTGRDLIVFLFTAAYAVSAPIFIVSTLNVLLAVLQTDSVLRVYAENRTLLLLNVARLIAIVALIGVFFSLFGILGAALITLLALALGKGLALLRMQRLMGTSLSGLLPWRSLAFIAGVAVLASVPALLVRSRLEPASFALLSVTGLVYAAAYVALAFLLLGGERGTALAWFSSRKEAEA